MKSDYIALKSLEQHNGYKILQALWIHETTKVEEARSRAAKKASEGTWKFWAGYEEGFKLAVTQLRRSLIHMESENEDLQGDGKFEELMTELRGEAKP